MPRPPRIRRDWSTMFLASGVARLWSQGGHRGSGGLLSPQRGLGAEPRCRSGGEARRSQIYTNNLQLSNAFLCRFVAESVLHLPSPTQQKLFGSVRIPRPNTAGAQQGISLLFPANAELTNLLPGRQFVAVELAPKCHTAVHPDAVAVCIIFSSSTESLPHTITLLRPPA